MIGPRRSRGWWRACSWRGFRDMPFPNPSDVADAVQALLQGDSKTATVQWARGRTLIDDPLTDPTLQDVNSGFLFVDKNPAEPKFIGGTDALGRNISQWEGHSEVIVV